MQTVPTQIRTLVTAIVGILLIVAVVVAGFRFDSSQLRAQLTTDAIVGTAVRTAVDVGVGQAVGTASGQTVIGLTGAAAMVGALTGQQMQLNVGETPLPDCGQENCLSIPTQASDWGGIVRTTTIIATIQYWVNFALSFLALIAVAIIVWSGFLYVTSRGEEDQIKKAKDGIIYAVIGIILITVAYAFVNTLIVKGATGAEPVAASILSID